MKSNLFLDLCSNHVSNPRSSSLFYKTKTNIGLIENYRSSSIDQNLQKNENKENCVNNSNNLKKLIPVAKIVNTCTLRIKKHLNYSFCCIQSCKAKLEKSQQNMHKDIKNDSKREKMLKASEKLKETFRRLETKVFAKIEKEQFQKSFLFLKKQYERSIKCKKIIQITCNATKNNLFIAFRSISKRQKMLMKVHLFSSSIDVIVKQKMAESFISLKDHLQFEQSSIKQISQAQTEEINILKENSTELSHYKHQYSQSQSFSVIVTQSQPIRLNFGPSKLEMQEDTPLEAPRFEGDQVMKKLSSVYTQPFPNQLQDHSDTLQVFMDTCLNEFKSDSQHYYEKSASFEHFITESCSNSNRKEVRMKENMSSYKKQITLWDATPPIDIKTNPVSRQLSRNNSKDFITTKFTMRENKSLKSSPFVSKLNREVQKMEQNRSNQKSVKNKKMVNLKIPKELIFKANRNRNNGSELKIQNSGKQHVQETQAPRKKTSLSNFEDVSNQPNHSKKSRLTSNQMLTAKKMKLEIEKIINDNKSKKSTINLKVRC